MEPDLNQEIYGLPKYLSAAPSALLNESATLFRRKYYINGSHAWFIKYMIDAAQNQEDVSNIHQEMKSAKGRATSATCLCTRPTAKRTGFRASVARSGSKG
jgi:capsid portal protein